MKRTFLALVAVLFLGLAAIVPSAPAAADMTRAEVETIIEEYILNNADVILQSVTDHQTRGVADRQKQALDANRRALYSSPIAPIAGNEDSDVRVVEFFDYNCGYCKRVIGDVMRLIEGEENIAFIFKEFPILGPTSETASRWALAAAKQDKYVEFHHALMTATDRVSETMLETIARDLDLDIERMKKDAQAEDITNHINETRELAQELGITGTPAFIIEDQVLPGAIGYDAMTAAIAAKRTEE